MVSSFSNIFWRSWGIETTVVIVDPMKYSFSPSHLIMKVGYISLSHTARGKQSAWSIILVFTKTLQLMQMDEQDCKFIFSFLLNCQQKWYFIECRG